MKIFFFYKKKKKKKAIQFLIFNKIIYNMIIKKKYGMNHNVYYKNNKKY